MIWQIEGFSVLGVLTFNWLREGHWVRVDYYIVINWTHVSVIIQCQNDDCSLSCKDGAVFWQYFGQLVAGCLTFLEMAFDDHCSPHFLVHFGAITVNEFSDSNAWIALTDVPSNEFHWPLYTDWRLGWYRTLTMPVSIHSCEWLPVIIDWYSTLCHTKCKHSPTWSVQWLGTASKVCLCPIPTSNERPLR